MTATLTSAPAIVRTIAELRRRVSEYRTQAGPGAKVGLVPTMGFLHEGHASLMRRSAADNGLTVLSIFVNPLQFGPNEDFERYPRDEARDLAVAAEAGAQLVFLPEVKEMYPTPPSTKMTVSGITEMLCGASRPGHFDGVGVVVTKLFNIVQPDRAYFGLKDAQQVAVVARIVSDLNQPVEIVPCPIVRESDGLALSSRNVYLKPEEREQALVLSQTLRQVPAWIREGAAPGELKSRMAAAIARMPLAEIDYVEVLTYPELQAPSDAAPLRDLKMNLLAAVAVKFGQTRLIDNVLLNPTEVI
ncbi:pantoate--beta-alanine ligase [Cohnella nanjingensis]|uniref:Pantothenate synthetase n=1 Tax=Cohnella nanjingensis TaxID=1387779 RepID=A0A7X0RV12_9BACL|nr:pantoate--beta-alanine ligase [Cohnella nanjingensis]MBB6674098.1 pantoate--beta-alanine ligase [Cohnella nanjingensis]